MAKTIKSKNGNGATKTGATASAFTASLAKVITLAQGLESAIEALDLPGLTADERIHADGRLRVGEARAITCIFDTMDAFPATFESLADKDGGSDPDVLETGPARAALAEATALQPLGAVLTGVQGIVSDAILALASQAKALSVPGYAIGKANASVKPAVSKALAAALDFYGAAGRKRVLVGTKVANAAKKTAKAAKPAKAAPSA